MSEDPDKEYNYLTDIDDVSDFMDRQEGAHDLDHLGLPQGQSGLHDYDLDSIHDSLSNSRYDLYPYYHPERGRRLYDFLKEHALNS